MVKWTVLTPTKLPEGDDWVFFGLTPRAYEDLSFNMADVLRWVREAMWRLQYYRGDLSDQRLLSLQREEGTD